MIFLKKPYVFCLNLELIGSMLPFHMPPCWQDFKNGNVDTAFIPKHEKELAAVRSWYNPIHHWKLARGTVVFLVKTAHFRLILTSFRFHFSKLIKLTSMYFQFVLMVVESKHVVKCLCPYQPPHPPSLSDYSVDHVLHIHETP